ncbi:transposase [uncultured Ottowia sp.]|uniref:transposase n=1 Tax=uncultured Ottowia sp. TaxID=543067 RepID=UPI002592DE5C|nr:transposase [uncultured Ottowia sp.]
MGAVRPTYSVTKLMRMIKGLMTREAFRMRLQVKNQLEDGEFWPAGHFVSTVGKYGDEAMIGEYAKNQGGDYKMLHSAHQLSLF